MIYDIVDELDKLDEIKYIKELKQTILSNEYLVGLINEFSKKETNKLMDIKIKLYNEPIVKEYIRCMIKVNDLIRNINISLR